MELRNQQVQTFRTIPSNNSGTIISDNKIGTRFVIDFEIPRGRNMINIPEKEIEEILKYKVFTIGSTAHVQCSNRSVTSNNRGQLEPFQIHSDST